MRVIAGTARGMPLRTVKGLGVRPTTDRVKETLFNVLQPRVPGCRFLDLYAGSGAIGIEALSRGAAAAVLVEIAGAHLRVLHDNLTRTGLQARATVLRRDARRVPAELGARGEQFDLIFMDPPYGQGLVGETLAAVAAHGVLAPGGWAVAEHHRKDPVPETVGSGAGALVRFREIELGETVLSFWREAQGSGSERSMW